MSNFFSRTNLGRIDKMLDLFGHLETSARSNGATADDWAKLLDPMIGKLAEVTADVEIASKPTAPAPASHWINAIHFAREVPIQNAAAAIQILATRLEEHLEDQQRGAK